MAEALQLDSWHSPALNNHPGHLGIAFAAFDILQRNVSQVPKMRSKTRKKR